MYDVLLVLHSLNRWLVLVLLVAATAGGVHGWISRRPWSEVDERIGVLTTAALDLQLLLGLLLYLVFSPLTRAGFADVATAMDDPTLRFWLVEHGPVMLVAIVLVHLGRTRIRRAESGQLHRRAAAWFGTATVLVLAAIPWPFLPYGRGLLPWS